MSARLERLPGRRVLEEIGGCPGCGERSWHNLRRRVVTEGELAERLGLLERGDEIALALCSRCGLVFVSPRLSPDTLLRYYTVTCPANELRTLPADRATNERYARRERARFQRLARIVRRHRPRAAVVVDVGALDGASLRPYLDAGARGIAIEPGIGSRRAADRRVETAESLEALAAEGIRPDVVLSTQTFEHLASPRLVLGAALAALSENGVVVVEVPYDLLDMGFLADPGQPVRPGHPEHVNFFTTESIARLATASGADVLEVSAGAQIHKYGGLIPSVTLVTRLGTHPAGDRPAPLATPERLRAVLEQDRPLVGQAQRRMKIMGLLARRGRW